ncbi:DUF1830 domain-containing protein [Pseudanabaena sp. 'Roaring Creek']|uniref:DUF1830 domain-containing protein n=1 Tax=Pseudanabaena sp. 'Roaring Creek' TaxID=1681830 RepID=UPI0006D7CE4E|nr:DUF1830 domain-containing protein [Pseudanabaena sp. 'Roaring Creek']
MLNKNTKNINIKSSKDQHNQITCLYRNEGEVVQILRVSHADITFWEKAIFPNQCIQFSAPRDALLEIHAGFMCSAIHSDTIPCVQLAIIGMDMGREVADIREMRQEFRQDIFATVA